MGELKIKDKEIVVPGQILAEGMDYLPAGGAYRDKEEIISSTVGIVSLSGRLVKLVSLITRYIPKKGDKIIGKVTDTTTAGWLVDFGFSKDAMIPIRDGSYDFIPKRADLKNYFAPGEYVLAGITNVTKSKAVDLSMKGQGLRKLSEGRIIKVNAAKVPRIIGKEGSMISIIKETTDCRISVGQNGLVWISGTNQEKERLAVEAIKLIDEKAHIPGLTDEIKKFLEGKQGGKSGTR